MLLVQQQRQPQPEHELEDARDDRVEERVEQRQPRDRVAPQELVVLEADPLAGAADLGVGEAEPDAQAERIGQEQQQQHRRRQHEQQPERVAVVLQPFEKPSSAERCVAVARARVAARPSMRQTL